jgi:hypothetical protein
MLRSRDVLLLDGAAGVSDWKKQPAGPANEPTIYIPVIRVRQPVESLGIPAWVGQAAEWLIWTVIAAGICGMLFLTLRILIYG